MKNTEANMEESLRAMDTEPKTGPSLPLHPLTPAPEPDNAGVASQLLHPVTFPRPVLAYNHDVVSVLEDFAYYVAAINEQDYGDWMRRVNVYLNHLRLDMMGQTGESAGFVESMFKQIQVKLQYAPNFSIPETRTAVLTVIMEMRKVFGAESEMDLHRLGLSSEVPHKPNHPPAWAPIEETYEAYRPAEFTHSFKKTDSRNTGESAEME